MQQRRVGSTGLRISRLGLGTWLWGKDTDEHEARDQLASFTAAGGTLIDTAAGYGDGLSEELLGSMIGSVVDRDDVVIATKAGLRPAGSRPRRDTSRGTLLRQLDRSLQLLDVDAVDLWQVHVWSDDTPLDETLSALELAVASGRARYVGLQLHRVADRTGRDRSEDGPRPHPTGLDAGGVLAGQPRCRG
jgi:aryl-alcohol dehydrogenase-like predicted oxidoreductase